jgi:hypothetical protein
VIRRSSGIGYWGWPADPTKPVQELPLREGGPTVEMTYPDAFGELMDRAVRVAIDRQRLRRLLLSALVGWAATTALWLLERAS